MTISPMQHEFDSVRHSLGQVYRFDGDFIVGM